MACTYFLLGEDMLKKDNLAAIALVAEQQEHSKN
jgi:hypothetical protein